MFRKVLIANRGEIALRIIRTLREMDIGSVAAYSDADRESRFVLEADEAFRIGPPPASQSYLDPAALLAVAQASGADAVHPGYGFLAENASFAEAVVDAGLTFIGPRPESMRLMGDKIAARKVAIKAGVPVVPGTPESVGSSGEALRFIDEHGLPVLVKAAGGGGGRGIRMVERRDDLEAALEAASREAGTYFNDQNVYLERFYDAARHIEVQIAGDVHGNVVAWGERDCSTQRRRQKLIEETPAPGLSDADRSELLSAATRLASAVSYIGVGTVEFLYTGSGDFHFLEMNTRIQVEHTITEQVTGLDLIRESVTLATGEPVTPPPDPRGHAIEARINAEDPADEFRPGPGHISVYREPGGPGVRVDSGVYEGFTVPGDYDSLIAKLVVCAPNRQDAIQRMLGALHGYHIEGIPTTIDLLRTIIGSEAFRDGSVTTAWLDQSLKEMVADHRSNPPEFGPEAVSAREATVEVNGKRFKVRLFEQSGEAVAAGRQRLQQPTPRRSVATGNQVVSPMRGTVLSVAKAVGDEVTEGESLVVVEAMKMENEIRAPRAATIKAVLVMVGDTVENRQPLIELAP